MTYQELREVFRTHESARPNLHLTARITLSNILSTELLSPVVAERSFLVSSFNKAFRPGMFSQSLYGYRLSNGEYVFLNNCLDGSAGNHSMCSIIRYDLVCIKKETPAPAQSFWSHDEALDALFQKLAEEGSPDAESLKAKYQTVIKGDLYRTHQFIESLNKMKHTWRIHYSLISNPQQAPIAGGVER